MVEYKPEYKHQVVAIIEKGGSLGAWRNHLGITRSVYRNWRRDHPDFRLAVNAAWENFRKQVPYHPFYVGQVIETVRQERSLPKMRQSMGIPLQEWRKWRRDHPDFDSACRTEHKYKYKHIKYLPEYLDQVSELIFKGESLISWRKKHNVSTKNWRKWRRDHADFNTVVKMVLDYYG